MGEGIIEAVITRWLVRKGDQVNIDDPLVEIATDKVDSEVTSPAGGFIHKILLEEGDVAKIGQVLAMIRTEEEEEDKIGDPADTAQDAATAEPEYEISDPADSAQDAATAEPEYKISDPAQIELSAHETDPAGDPDSIPNSKILPGQVYLSPQVKKLIREYRLSQSEIKSIKGTGKNGRLTHRDLLGYISERATNQPEAAQAKQVTEDPV